MTLAEEKKELGLVLISGNPDDTHKLKFFQFDDERNRIIRNAMRELAVDGQDIDVVHLVARLAEQGYLGDKEGPKWPTVAYIASLTDYVGGSETRSKDTCPLCQQTITTSRNN